MKKFILLCLLLVTSNTVFAASPKHFVFLVYGISAGPMTFGNMTQTIPAEAKRFDPHTNWKFINFEYQTGNYNKDVMIFAKELSDFIALNFKASGGINPEDKFSLIMHSQGGLIGLNFLMKAFQGDEQFHPELKNHLDAFITMGTPYWGAKIAIFANRMMPLFAYLKIPLSDQFGERELKDMELASDFSATMREELISSENQRILKEITSTGRFLVFSGVTERLNILTPLSTGKNRYEDDTAVPIPSSRLDFLYYKDAPQGHNDSVGVGEFKETNMLGRDDYVVVNAFHASPFHDNPKFPGISYVPKRCIGIPYEDCNHPVYPTLVQHLFKLPRDPLFVRDLESFAIELKINAAGKPVDRKNLLITFKPITTGLKIGKDIELYNKITRWTVVGNYRMYQTGYIDAKQTSSNLGRVEMTVMLPGYRERKLIVPVKTALSTFVELNLED